MTWEGGGKKLTYVLLFSSQPTNNNMKRCWPLLTLKIGAPKLLKFASLLYEWWIGVSREPHIWMVVMYVCMLGGGCACEFWNLLCLSRWKNIFLKYKSASAFSFRLWPSGTVLRRSWRAFIKVTRPPLPHFNFKRYHHQHQVRECVHRVSITSVSPQEHEGDLANGVKKLLSGTLWNFLPF